MKKSKVLFVTLLASLGFVGVSGTGLLYTPHLNFGVVAKADAGIPNVITNRSGDMSSQLLPAKPVDGYSIQHSMFLSAAGETSVYAGGNAVTSISKTAKGLVLNLVIKNEGKKNNYFRTFVTLPVNTDGSPILKIGLGGDAEKDQYFLSPEKLGLTSENWIPDLTPQDGKKVQDGLQYRGDTHADYDYTPDGTIASQRKVSAIGLFGTVLADKTIHVKIPVYLANPDSVTKSSQIQIANPFYNLLSDEHYQLTDIFNMFKPGNYDGTSLNVSTFGKNVIAQNASVNLVNNGIIGVTPNLSMFRVSDPKGGTGVEISKVVNEQGVDVTKQMPLKTAGKYQVTLTNPKDTDYGDTTVTLTVNDNNAQTGSTGSGSISTTVPAETLTPSTSTGQGSSTTTTPTTKPSTSTQFGSNIAVKGEAVYATKAIGLYKSTSFTKSNRIVSYAKESRINRPMFVVTGYKYTTNGTLRYKVRDVNHGRKTAGKTGYITASRKYVVPVYYASVPKAKKITVIATKGINAYKSANLTGKTKHYRKGVHLTVKKLVKHNLTTRYQLSSGWYITANKKLVMQK